MTQKNIIPIDQAIVASAIARSKALIATDPELRALMPNLDVAEDLRSGSLPCEQIIDRLLTTYASRPAVGTREYEIVKDQKTGREMRNYKAKFETQTYKQLQSDIRSIANAWRHLPAVAVHPDEFVIILGFASAEYFALDCATTYAQAVSVPMQSASSGADLNDIFNRIEPSCLATTYEDLDVAVSLASGHGSLRSLIVFDVDIRIDVEREAFELARQRLRDKGVEVLTYQELVEKGQEFYFEFYPAHRDRDERLTLIIHSSGSTGVPKGAMISAGTVKQYWIGTLEKHPSIGVVFSPLNHVLGRANLLQIIGKGSTAYFTLASDMSTLFEDIRIVRPTWLIFFPRVLDMIYQHFQNDVMQRISQGQKPEDAKTAVMEDMRHSFLGDRLTTATVGSAPTSQAVKDFIAECFQIWMWDGYGSTEAGAGSVTINGVVNRKTILDYKLRDVPELGYYVTDKPYPRGEFCFKGRNQIKGFYKDPKATSELLTDDGYIITGDIVEEREQDRIVIVDRRKDVVKLSQGEYVAVGPLGAVFEGGSPFIKQIYIYGNSHRAYLVAVVVPDMDVISHTTGHTPKETEIKHIIRDAIADVATAESLKSFEAPRDFIIESEPFSQENGLLSSVRKKLRPALKRKYGEALEALYLKHEQSREDEITQLKQETSVLDTKEILKRLIIIHLGLEDTETISDKKSFGDIGGDSLGAVNFSLLVEDVFDLIFPADKILDPTASISSWARDIDRLKSSDEKQVDFKSIHGGGARSVNISDLSLDSFLSESILSGSGKLLISPDEPKTVLLTGATGFLGRHVCLNWLSELGSSDAKLICLVRAESDDEAHKRLQKIFESSSPEMRDDFLALSKDKLKVIAGDIALPHFGLDAETFSDLSESVDRICHVGALVNHRLSYEHLFAPNVLGTAEIIKLALSAKLKPIDFVSTVSVLPLLDRKNPDKETAELIPTLKLSDSYASGYATSKWAAEALLRQAASKHNIPVNILRGNMMLSHRSYSGGINSSDMFTRLLFSLIATGIAPRSFYADNPVNYDGLPVDAVAASVVKARQANTESLAVMNIHNYNMNSRFSLDMIVKTLRKAGFDISEVESYDDWYQRFSERLHTLPEVQKQKSAIDLLPAFKHPQSSSTHMSCDKFKNLINSLQGDLPELGPDYVSKILNDMSAVGILDR